MIEADFEILKNGTGEIIGLSLIARPQTEAEEFCGTFIKALVEGKADIKFSDKEIIFEHPTCIFGRECIYEINPKEAVSLEKVLHSKKLKAERAGFLTPGFKIILA